MSMEAKHSLFGKLMSKVLPIVLLAVVVGFSFLLDTVPLGLVVSNGDGALSLVTADSSGGTCQTKVRWLSECKDVSFPLKVGAESFSFVFSADDSDRHELGIMGITICGIRILDGRQLSRFQFVPQEGARSSDSADKPLVLLVKSGDRVDFPNVFTFISRLIAKAFRVARMGSLMLLVALTVFSFSCVRRFSIQVADLFTHPVPFCILLVFSAIFTLPAVVNPFGPTLDPSWQWLMNRYAFTKTIGPDMVFTYGPLGFLISPQLTMLNVVVGMVCGLLFSMLYLWEMWVLYRQDRLDDGKGWVALVALSVWMLAWPNGVEWRWTALAIGAMVLSCFGVGFSERERRWLLRVSVVASVVLTFMKFSSFVVVAGAQVFMVLFSFWRNWRNGLLLALECAICWIVCFGIGTIVLFPDVGSAFNWVRKSLEIASGYNNYMVVDKSMLELTLPCLAVLTVYLVSMIGCGRRHLLGYWAVLFPVVFSAAKYALVRQTAAPLCLMLAIFSAFQVLADAAVRRRAIVMCACFALMSVAFIQVFGDGGNVFDVSFHRPLSWLTPAKSLQSANREGQKRVAKCALPKKWMLEIGTNGVMIVGSEFGPAMDGRLKLVPFPATQIYSAYTPYLDRICAEGIARNHEVKHLLVQADPWSTIDSKNIYLDNPRIFSVAKRNYAYVGTEGDWILLRRRENATDEVEEPVPPEGVDLLERLCALLFRSKRHFVSLKTPKGEECFAAINPYMVDSSKLPPVPLTRQDAVEFWKN